MTQVAASSWVPFVVLAPGSSRHSPDAGFTRVFPVPCCHCWLDAPLQVFSSVRVPDPPPVVSRHRPLTLTVPVAPLDGTVQFCSASLRHVEISAAAPDVELSPGSSMHMGVPLLLPPSETNIPDGIGRQVSMRWSRPWGTAHSHCGTRHRSDPRRSRGQGQGGCRRRCWPRTWRGTWSRRREPSAGATRAGQARCWRPARTRRSPAARWARRPRCCRSSCLPTGCGRRRRPRCPRWRPSRTSRRRRSWSRTVRHRPGCRSWWCRRHSRCTWPRRHRC